MRYHSALRQQAGVDQEHLALNEGTALLRALELLAERHGAALREALLTPEGGISAQIVVFHNGQLARLDLPGPALKDGDEVKLFPKISGGS